MLKRGIILILILCASAAVFAAQTRPRNQTAQITKPESPHTGAETASGLTVRWDAVTCRDVLYNPAVPLADRDSRGAESLSLSCEIKMSDPRLLLGTAPDPRIEKIKDSQGKDVKIIQEPPPSRRPYVQGAFWTWWLRDINLNHPERAGIRAEQQPPAVKLDGGLRERLGGEIGLLKGYYEALMAESIEYIDLPFKPDSNWVRLTEDVEIKVVQARNAPDVFHFDIEQRPEMVLSADRVVVGEPLPHRLVVGRQMITRAGSMAGGSGGGRIGGRGNGIGRAEGIRYVIAVNPAPVRIPFEFHNVPVSTSAQATPPHTLNPERLKPQLGGKFIPPAAQIAKKYEADKARSRTKPVPVAKENQFFDVNWTSIGYTLHLYNPAVTRRKDSLDLSVVCNARILYPELVLGACDEPVIERITDGSGTDVDISLTKLRPDYMIYKTPGYRIARPNSSPSPLAQSKSKAPSSPQPPGSYGDYSPRPQRETVLEPVRLIIRLDPRLIGQDQKEIKLVEGYFHALMASSYKNIEVPFKASSKWVRLTSDLAIQVAKAWHDGDKYRFLINERSKAQIEPGRLHVYCPLPDGILVERQLTGPDTPPQRDDRPRTPQALPAPAGANGFFRSTVDGVDCQIDTIDYRIALNPIHYEIPIKLEHIPLPKW